MWTEGGGGVLVVMGGRVGCSGVGIGVDAETKLGHHVPLHPLRLRRWHYSNRGGDRYA